MFRRSLLFCAIAILVFLPACERRARVAEPAASALGGGDYDFSLTYNGLERTYKVHIPTGYNANSPTPVVIYLHGGGGSNESAYREGLDKYSDKFGFILAAPNGTGRLSDKLLTWNAGAWSGGDCCGYAVKNNVDDVGFISQMLDDLKTKFNMDEKRVYATGLSNGAMMSYRLACDLAARIAAVAPVAPPAIPQNCSPARPVSVMHIHGTADPCAVYNGGPAGGCLGSAFIALSAREMVDAWIQKNGVSTTPETTYQNGSATCLSYLGKDAIEVEFCTITGGGHTWPSGAPYMPEERVGPVSFDMSFDQMWEFFSRHELP